MNARPPAPQRSPQANTARPQAQGPAYRRWDLLALVSLVVLHLAFLSRAALLRGFIVHSDICYFFQPVKASLHESLRAGRLPLWTPYIFCGYPLAAEAQTAVFYPVSLVVSWLLPSWAAVNWLIILHLLLAAVGMFLLARSLRLSTFAAWLAAFVLSFSGFFFARVQHLSLLAAASWLPLTLLFVERAWRGRLLPSAALAAACWGAAALCGHPQTVFHITLIILFWLAWRVLQSPPQPIGRAAALVALVLGLGAGLAAVQILLTAGVAAAFPHGQRGDYAYITSYPLLPKHLLGLLAPNWQGTVAYGTYHAERHYWGYVLYIGIVPLLLALIGACSRRGRAMALLAIIALVLALKPTTPIYHVLRHLPGFADFRVPARFIFVFTFAAALLAAHGWETLTRGLKARGRRVLALGALVVLSSVPDLLLFDRTLAPLASPAVATASNAVADIVHRDPAWSRVFILPPFEITADWIPKGGWKVNPDGWAQARSLLAGDVAMSYRLRQLLGYMPFVDFQLGLLVDDAKTAAAQHRDLRLLSLLGTRYLAVSEPHAFPGLPSQPAGPYTVYRNPDAFPRVFAVGDLIQCHDPDQARMQVRDLALADHLRQAAVIEGDLGGFRPSALARVRADLTELRPEHFVIRATADGDALLVLNEHWDPGWKASLDGRPSPLVKVDAVLMGTPLPKGTHTVTFHYRPRQLVVGRAISIVSLGLWAILLVAPLLRRRATADQPEPTPGLPASHVE